jgi:hypothetical protein
VALVSENPSKGVAGWGLVFNEEKHTFEYIWVKLRDKVFVKNVRSANGGLKIGHNR